MVNYIFRGLPLGLFYDKQTNNNSIAVSRFKCFKKVKKKYKLEHYCHFY